jgi:hypothetical protein
MTEFRPFNGTLEEWNAVRCGALRRFVAEKSKEALNALFDVFVMPRGTFVDHIGELKAIVEFYNQECPKTAPNWKFRILLGFMFWAASRMIGKQEMQSQYERMRGQLTSVAEGHAPQQEGA